VQISRYQGLICSLVRDKITWLAIKISWLVTIARCERDEAVFGHLAGRGPGHAERLNGQNEPFFGSSVENQPPIPIVNQGIFIANYRRNYRQPGYFCSRDADFGPKLSLIRSRDSVPPATVLMDPGYGNDSKLRTGISELGLTYVAGILPTTVVWRPGETPLPPAPRSGRGRPGTRLRRDETHRPVSAKTLALELAADAWQQIKWRDGSNTPLTSRFARWRVRPARDDGRRSEPAAEEWLLIEWPEGEAEPDHYWLSTLQADISPECMVDQAKMRWRIERDYLELKQEVGLGHYEGRGWRGFHHHATLCVAAYGFLISEKETIPPSGHPRPRRGAQSLLPDGYRPRGSAAAFTAPHAELNCHVAYPPGSDFGPRIAAMSLLRTDASERGQAE
jgi:DDE superfamily endonuclease